MEKKIDSWEHIIVHGKYLVQEKLGSGAFGDVYHCKDRGTGEE